MPRPSGACVSKALEQEPRAFGESAEEHRATSIEVFSKRLSAASDDNYVLGAFAGGKVWWAPSGSDATHASSSGIKPEFGECLWTDEHRGQGIARRLMSRSAAACASLAGLEQIILTVGDHQAAAKRLYSSLGFTIFGHERGALKMGDGSGDEYVDEDYMVFMLPKPKRRSDLGFRKILPVQKFLRGLPNRQSSLRFLPQAADYRQLRHPRAAPSPRGTETAFLVKRKPKTANSFQQGSLGQHDTRRIRCRLQKGLQSDGAFLGIARPVVRFRAGDGASRLGQRLGTPGPIARSRTWCSPG